MEGFSNPRPKLLLDNQDTSPDYSKSDAEYNKIEPVYFAFIDILGFKRTIDDEIKQGKNDFNDSCKKVFEFYFDLIAAAQFYKVKECYAGQTSDSLYFYTRNKKILIEFLRLFSYFNLYAMSENVFFRGGIAKGELFVKELHQFYGNSVIYAYLLESVVAQKPAVYISEEVYNEFINEDIANQLIDSWTEASRYFLKPFAGYGIEINDILENNTILKSKTISMEMIENNIKKNKMKFQYERKNFEKYIFLLHAFNEMRNEKNEKN